MTWRSGIISNKLSHDWRWLEIKNSWRNHWWWASFDWIEVLINFNLLLNLYLLFIIRRWEIIQVFYLNTMAFLFIVFRVICWLLLMVLNWICWDVLFDYDTVRFTWMEWYLIWEIILSISVVLQLLNWAEIMLIFMSMTVRLNLFFKIFLFLHIIIPNTTFRLSTFISW